MASAEQAVLIDIPEQPLAEPPTAAGGALKLRRVDRRQTVMLMLDVEVLIGPDHKARASWYLAGRMDLTAFTAAVKTREGQAGREAWDPQLLVSLWVYAYSEGISSAQEIEREMEWEPGFQWLGGLKKVNHHTLSDFRVEHQAARERKERVERAYGELQALQHEKGTEQEKQAVRVSMTEPEARMMKHGDNAIAPSYNAQITTYAAQKIIVGVHLSQSSSDAQSLAPALAEVEANLGRRR